jgi:hypothetical protein
MKKNMITLKVYDHQSAGFFKKVQLEESYVTSTLGFSKKELLESDGDMQLYESIYNEHLVFEGFLDSVKGAWEKTKKAGGDASKVFSMLNNLFSDPQRLSIAKEQAMALASRALKPIIAKNDVMPNVKKLLEEMEESTKSKQGWKGFLGAVALLLAAETIRDNIEAFTVEGVQQSFMKMLEDIHNDMMMDSPINTIASWLARVGKVLMKGTEIIGDLYRVLSRVEAIKSGAGQVVDDKGGQTGAPVPA